MEGKTKERSRGATSSGKVSFWNFQLSMQEVEKLLGEVGMAEQREYEKRLEEKEITYQPQQRPKEQNLDRS